MNGRQDLSNQSCILFAQRGGRELAFETPLSVLVFQEFSTTTHCSSSYNLDQSTDGRTYRSQAMATAPRNRMKSLCHVLPLVLLFASSPSGRAQEDLCPDFAEIDPLIDCLTVSSYGALVDLIESAPSGAQLDLCPFFLMKIESVVPARVLSGIQVRCIRKTSDDFCVISGEGHHLWIDTSENTLWQGMSFRNSNDHAVYIAGESDNSELASHTFCHTSFIENVRFLDSRGGALMIEPSVGTVNIVETLFSENFSKSYGAGIYARGHQLNVVNSVFSRNRANGYGPAIFTASDVSLMIKGSTFVGNLGRDRFEVVFNGGKIVRSPWRFPSTPFRWHCPSY